MAAMIPVCIVSSIAQPQSRRNALIASIATVNAGSARFELLNTEATCGTT